MLVLLFLLFFIVFSFFFPASIATSEPADEQVHQESSEVEEWQHRLKSMFDDLSCKLQARSDTFLPGIKKLVTTYENLRAKKSENALSSALHYISSVLKTGHRIRKQPGRTGPHLGGRKCKQTGRPLKVTRTGEHGYGKLRKAGPMHPVPPTKSRNIAPHSLAQKVDSLRM